MCIGFADEESVKDLLKECAKMMKFDHPNVLKLRGVCLDGGPAPYIIMPFIVNGSLLSYLKENRESITGDSIYLQGEVESNVRMCIMCMAKLYLLGKY